MGPRNGTRIPAATGEPAITVARKKVLLKTLTEEIEKKYVPFNNNNWDNSRSMRMDNETICIVGRKL